MSTIKLQNFKVACMFLLMGLIGCSNEQFNENERSSFRDTYFDKTPTRKACSSSYCFELEIQTPDFILAQEYEPDQNSCSEIEERRNGLEESIQFVLRTSKNTQTAGLNSTNTPKLNLSEHQFALNDIEGSCLFIHEVNGMNINNNQEHIIRFTNLESDDLTVYINLNSDEILEFEFQQILNKLPSFKPNCI